MAWLADARIDRAREILETTTEPVENLGRLTECNLDLLSDNFSVKTDDLLGQKMTVTLKFHDDHLTMETGLFSRTWRTVDTAKIQDVTVRQSFGQRLVGVGDLVLEDAGESGGMQMPGIDRPRQIADEIIASSKRVRS